VFRRLRYAVARGEVGARSRQVAAALPFFKDAS
jgi:hypothetical protein